MTMTSTQAVQPAISDTVRRAQKGDESSLRLLYERFHPGIYRYLYYQVGDQQTAEDLAGDVFVRMIQALPSFRLHQGTFQAWLYRIAHNLAVDHLRQGNANHAEELSEEHPAQGDDPQVVVDQRLTSQALQRALATLNVDQRDVIVLRFIARLPIEGTAQALGRSKDAIKGLQRRGLVALRAALQETEVAHDESG
jgi:RNA polymerase sigma-70 factor (ECF subfamily)